MLISLMVAIPVFRNGTRVEVFMACSHFDR